MMMTTADSDKMGERQPAEAEAALHAALPAPRVSMILPVHNGAAFLEQAVDSVLQQTFTDFELICVDDGSTDATPQLLARFAAADSRVRVITNRPNKGLPGALNVGFAAARGMFHTWTSDDNIVRPHMLERLVSALESNPGAAIAHGNFSVINDEGAVIGFQKMGPASEILFGNRIGAAFLYRAIVTEALEGYDETLFGVEDYDFWLRAARRFQFVTLDEDLYLYRRHPGSLTDRRTRMIHRLVAQIVQRELALISDPAFCGRVLLEHGLASQVDPRLGMLMKAFLLAPRITAGRLPAIVRHLGGHVVRSLAPGKAATR